MSFAEIVLKKQGFTLLDHKGLELDLHINENFNQQFKPITIIEGKDYFELYLRDNGSVFADKFSGMVPLGLEDIKTFGYELVSIELSKCDKFSMRLPWYQGQKVIHVLLSSSDGIPSKFDVMSVKPRDVDFMYNIRKRTIKLIGQSVSQIGYKEYAIE